MKPNMDIDQPSMAAEVNSYKPGTGLVWPTLFPLKYTSKFDLKGIEGNEGIPVTADRVAFNSKSKDKRRTKVGTWNAQLGKIMISRSKDELEINEYLDLKAIVAANPTDADAKQELVNIVYDDLRFCANGMDYRTEVEALTVGSMGKRVFSAKFDGDMVEEQEINFNVPSENFMGVTVKWDNLETADGLGDIMKGQKIITKKGGRKPQWAIMEQTAFDNLCNQKKTIKRVASVVIKAAGLESEANITLDAINRYMRSKGAPQLLVIEPYVTIEDEDGKRHTEQPWNPNSVVLSPEPRLGYTWYKSVPTVAGTDALQTYGPYYKETRYGDVNPMTETTMAEAYIQPALSNRSHLVYINCMATTWNNGEV